MYDDIICFLKFGEREHIQSLAAGQFYFTNAVTIRKIEREQHIVGQGDYLEGGSIIVARNMTVIDRATEKVVASGLKGNMIIHYEPSNETPLFCLFACYEKDCSILENGALKLHLNREVQYRIREDFPKADTVAVISNPAQLIEDVKSSFEDGCVADKIHYFHLKGIPHGEEMVNDFEYLKFLTQDDVDGRMSFKAEYAYRSLYCKDVRFQGEQEFRFVLNKRKISEPRTFNVKLSNAMNVYPISYVLPDVEGSN